MNQVEVVKRVKENLVKNYPLSALELADEVTRLVPGISRNKVWQSIQENGLKRNTDYSAFNFRNKKHEDEYRNTGQVPSSTPSIYNQAAVEFLVKVLTHKKQ